MSTKKGKRDQTFIIKGETQLIKITQQTDPVEKDYAELNKIKYLQIPRKPTWHGKTLEEQKQEQNVVFLEWRKHLGSLQDNFPDAVLTPYEKNFEVWKQLWYVVEKSEILIQIIDCRDPLFYRCEDLENYVSEMNKKNFLLINKADLVPESVRKSISEFLKSQNRSHVFFSALLEQEQLDLLEEEELKNKKEVEQMDDLNESQNKVKEVKNIYDLNFFKERVNTEKMFGREELIQFFEFFAKYKERLSLENLEIAVKAEEINPEPLVKPEIGAHETGKKSTIIGMVGYPNVGKSSVINAICGKKKVGVDAKPGKTKNLQTILFSPTLTLCDCPGLIFPSVVSSKAEMICNGVISIETSIEYIDPINYILQTVPPLLLKYLYKLPLTYDTQGPGNLDVIYNAQFTKAQFDNILNDQNLAPINKDVEKHVPEHHMTAREFLQLFAGTRGYVTGSAMPDECKAAKVIIKDYVQGKIPHFKIPQHNEFIKQLEFEKIIAELKENIKTFMIVKNLKSEDLLVNQKKIIENQIHHDLEVIADVESEDRKVKVEFLTTLGEDDIVGLIEGKTVEGIKLTREERRELKFLAKRNPPVQQVIGLLKSFLFKPPSDIGVKGKKHK